MGYYFTRGITQMILRLVENGDGAAKGDHEETVRMETDTSQQAASNDIVKADMGDNSKELVIADELVRATTLTMNDEEMLEDPLDVPPENMTTSAKLAVNISAQPSVKTSVQAPLSDDKENDIAARSIWVRGLTSATKAADLKVLCTQYGKVVRAKIYTSKKQSTSACYGYVTMADTAAAEKAASAMHKTQIKGRTISVEKADKSKVPAVKSTAATPMKKDANDLAAKRDSEKKSAVDGVKNKAPIVAEKSQSTEVKTKSAGSSTSTLSKRDNSRSDRKRDDKEKQRSSHSEKRDSEKPLKSSFGKRDFSRRVVARDPRRDSQRTISAARRYPLTRGIASHSLRGRITRPGERGGYMSSIRRPETMSQRDLLTLMRRKEEEHRRREAEIEKERALERERERIRFEREQLEKERLQLQLQAALQQQKMAAISSSRTKDSYTTSRSTSRVRHGDYRTSRDGRGEKLSSSSPRHRSTTETRRSLTESRSRHIGSTDRSSSSRVERDRSEHKSSTATSRGRSRHDSYSSPRRHGSSQPASYSSGKEYDRGYSSSRGGHSFSGRGSSYFGNSRDAYSSTTSRIGSSTGWVSSSGTGFGSSSAWDRNGGSALSHSGSGSAWSGRGGAGSGGWSTFGSGGTSASGGMRYDYDKYQQRF
ncbi:hypothetical protein DICVIV_09382 [Dictyocaulus viviparus]|uniref:RRM domain-containing protein n=1 Tax=Dictyocaulus viviparus TaxID=29172 RepID=A0A0D8XIV8_DICVI|nr:hypothetical protein DICVIV_09382 [Dictyocaulus viviparus]